jgi:Small-conductance mechanosensitive channel
MDTKKLKQIDWLLGGLLFVVAAFVYLSTLEPTVSFWDCGEFIASSYKLEVGHAPGNPVFQIVARVFTFFGGREQAAVLVNAVSAICSALTIMFLFWTITHLGRRILERRKEALSLGAALAVLGAGVTGALAYTFSDSFWFSAVEAEVYAMSSLFTAVVFWAMLKWEEQADTPYANRWIVLIAYLMGLSIGVHLLNLLTIPALVFIYYYKKYPFSKKGAIYTLILSGGVLAAILFGIIPWVPKIASWFDLLFVNVLGLGFNSGTVFFVLLLFALSFWLIYYTYRRQKVLWNTIVLCFTVIMIGYSSFAVVVIRSSANTPTNENQPDNPFALGRYLAREQYGSAPLLYGAAYNSPVYSLETASYYTHAGDRYKSVSKPPDPVYAEGSKMFFPRMWSYMDSHSGVYEGYTNGRGKVVPGSSAKIPYFSDNLAFFFDYQVKHMYFRYFMWNFVGRQNDLHAMLPGDLFCGNWESGIGFIDRARLGDQSEGPEYLVQHKAKNHFYFLPLLLGIAGLLYQYVRDRRNNWVVFLLFFLTGLAIILYLNQTPLQVRERDYSYAGSFYAFAIWIGLGVMALYELLQKSKCSSTLAGALAGVACLVVPLQMASQTWDDHDRSHRYTARDMAYNYLSSCGPEAVLVTIGDNETFLSWYLQEVEGIRTDIRIMNTSLLGMDWYIDQMQYRMYDSPPVKFSIPRDLYLHGTNDRLDIVDRVKDPVSLRAAMAFVGDPKNMTPMAYGEKASYLPARKLTIPVNKENAIKSGIVDPKDADKMLDTIQLNIPEGTEYLDKSAMMVLDMLSLYEWDRPICFSGLGGALGIGLEAYSQFDGYVYTLVPMACETTSISASQVRTDLMYERLMKDYRLESLAEPRMFVDYQNISTFYGNLCIRNIFLQVAEALRAEGDLERVIAVLDRMQEVMPASIFPLNASLVYGMNLNAYSVVQAIDLYVTAGAIEKAQALADALVKETMASVRLFGKADTFYRAEFESNVSIIFQAANIMRPVDAERAQAYEQGVKDWYKL